MGNLQTFINLAKKTGSVAIVDEAGEVLGVLLSPEEYDKISGSLTGGLKQSKHQLDVEEINRQILQAQLAEKWTEPSIEQHPDHPAKGTFRSDHSRKFGRQHVPTDLPTSDAIPTNSSHHIKRQDLREEVLDPSFDFDGEG